MYRSLLDAGWSGFQSTGHGRDTIIATAILDRLLHHSTTINIRGESYRLKERRKAGLFPRPDEDSGRPAPFLSPESLQNGPRRQGSAAPRKTSAPLTAPGRSTDQLL